MNKETNLEFKGLYEKVSDPEYSFYEEMSDKYQRRFSKGIIIGLPIWLIVTTAMIIIVIISKVNPIIVLPVYSSIIYVVFFVVFFSSTIKIKNVRKILFEKNIDLLIELAQDSKRDSKTAFAIYALIDLGEKRVEDIIRSQEKSDSYYFLFHEDFLYAREVYAIKRGFKSYNEFELEAITKED